MRRRAVLLGILVVLAGCAGSPIPTAAPSGTDAPADATPTPGVTAAGNGSGAPTSSPTPAPTATPTPAPVLGDAPVEVYVENEVNDRDFEPLVADAVAYWEANASRYAWYAPDYELTGDRADAEVVVRVVPELEGCGRHANETGFLGCAPLVTSRAVANPPLTIDVVAGYADRSTRSVLIHEFGHTLGLDHDDEPRAYMTAYGDATRLPLPNATERAVPWRTRNLTVSVDPGDRQYPQYETEVREGIDHALAYLAGGALAANYTFAYVDDPAAADVVVRASATEDLCRGIDQGACVNGTFGRDPDDDGALEYYTDATIHVERVPRDEVGWWTARMLALRLGVTEPSELPDPLRHQEQADSRWWE